MLSKNCMDYVSVVILATQNKIVHELNKRILDRLDGEEKCYLSDDKIVIKGTDEFFSNVEYLNQMNPSGYPPHKLQLKIGAIVVCLKNIQPLNGLTNGTRGVVVF